MFKFLRLLLLLFAIHVVANFSPALMDAVIAQEEEDEDDEFEAEEILRDKSRELRHLKQELSEAEEDKVLIQATIKQLQIEVQLLRKVVDLRERLEKAEDNDDEDAIERLEEQVEEQTWAYERTSDIGEVEIGLREAKFELKIAQEERDRPAITHFNEMIKRREEQLGLVKQLHKAYDDEVESLFEPIERRVELSERILWVKEVLFGLEVESREDRNAANKTHIDETRKLVTFLDAALGMSRQWHQAVMQHKRAESRKVERQLEELEEELEPAWQIFELEIELQEAREEGNQRMIRELERELKAIRGEKVSIAPPSPKVPSKITAEEMAVAARLDFDRDVFVLLKKYCIDCHGAENQEGELNLQKLASETPFVRNSRMWLNVAEQTKNGVMPPADESQPSEVERRQIAAWLHNAIKNFDYSGIDNPGYEPTRRLTHQEYTNTVRDLFGMPIKVADKFPADLSGTSGFNNSANTLFIQPLLLERYIAAADEVIRQALPESATNDQRDAIAAVFVAMPNERVSEEAAVTKIARTFLKRAYRRPITDVEVSRAVKQFKASRSLGIDFRQSVIHIVRAALISPKFLLKNETPRESTDAYRVSDWELASRLSYFLWASMPDAELMQLAEDERLSDPAIIVQQVDRMLKDSKADTLGNIFASQWLGFQHLGTRVRAGPIDNPWCTDSLMDAMKAESAMLFTSLIRNDRPLQELITADYTFLNEELADFYRMSGIKGSHMRRVAIETPNRGGIFTHGGLLAVTSFPGRTSPVVRGKWILEDVLGTPPPPPPPNVSELSDEIQEREGLTRRQKLELHRQNPNCYACHSQIDPLGFSLENYDWFGRYKTHAGRRKIDATGQLPNGTKFSGAEGLKRVIIEQRMSDLTRQLTRKMLSYALGRQLEYYDEPAVRKIVKALEDNNNRMPVLIHETVRSHPFFFRKQQ